MAAWVAFVTFRKRHVADQTRLLRALAIVGPFGFIATEAGWTAEVATLLDVNVLLALAWPNHQHHAVAHRWFRRESRRGWATWNGLAELEGVGLAGNRSAW